MSPVPALRGERVLLRLPIVGDREDRMRCGRVDEFTLMCGGTPDGDPAYTAAHAQGWYDRIATEPHGWCIEVNGACIGTARLHGLNAEERRAHYAIGIFDPHAWNRGYGTETTRLVLGYAFETLHLHRVDLRVLAYNVRAIVCYRKCGFLEEGAERETVLVNGAWQSDVIMGILEQEYRRMQRDGDGAGVGAADAKEDRV